MKYLLTIFFVCFILVLSWFRRGFLFAGAEEQLSFYNYSRSLDLFSQIWYTAGTGYPALSSVPRGPYFFLTGFLFKIGISNILLQAVTFLALILIGTLSVYYLIKETIASDLEGRRQKTISMLAALFYFLNPFSMTQIWGRALSYQFFSFALVPSFLLFFVLSLKYKKLIFCLIGALLSLVLSSAYLSPAVVLTSWAGVIIYLLSFVLINKHNKEQIFFSLRSFFILLILWLAMNFFWIYPTVIHGQEMLAGNLAANTNIESLKGLSPNSVIQNVVRLIHREYYDGTYPGFFNSFLLRMISWLLPIFIVFALPTLKTSRYFLFFALLSVTSIFISIGANFPTGWLLVWLFKTFPILQVLRNPYEKFGINLVVAFSPFFAYGLIRLSEVLSRIFKSNQLRYFFVSTFVLVYFVVFVWPYWNGSFAGGTKANFWVQIPDYYKRANWWLNSQSGDFKVLHLPLLPEEGVTYTWLHPYEGVEASEFLFDKGSIARSSKVNSGYYSALMDKLGAKDILGNSPYWSNDNLDFKEDDLTSELAKLNVRYIVVHNDIDFVKRKTRDPNWIKSYLVNQPGIKKIQEFGELDIYQVEVPDNIQLIYSPDINISYRKVDASNYIVDINEAKAPARLYFLEQFHPGWEASIGLNVINTHTKIFSYANSWLIEKNGNYQVNIKYKPQESLYLGYKITLVSVIISVVILVIFFFKARNKFL